MEKKHDYMSTEIQDIKSLREHVQKTLKVQIKDMQLIPVAAIELLQLSNEKDVGIDSLSNIIKSDSDLKKQVLKTLNASLFTFLDPIDSIDQAINVFGFARIRNTAFKLLVYHRTISNISRQGFDLIFFWQHCLFVATLSRNIAIKLNYPDPELLYTTGLIHDIGMLMLEMHGKASYSSFITSYANNTSGVLENELKFFGITHEQAGLIFCLEAQLPEAFTAVVCHHNPGQSCENYIKYKKEIAILSFADYLAKIHGVGATFMEKTPILPQTVIDVINIESIDIESLFDLVDQDMQTSHLYGVQFPTTNQLRARLVQTSIRFSKSNFQSSSLDSQLVHNSTNFIASLTIPHQSLDPEIFIPETLRAIRETFNLDRVCMLNMTSRQRSLVAKYCCPEIHKQGSNGNLEIKVDNLIGDLLTCLRTQQATIVSDKNYINHRILEQIGVTAFIAIPILRNNRLSAVLYADNNVSKTPINSELLTKITPITNELGSALYNAKRYKLERTKAEMDPLTGLSNKRMITDFLDKIFSEKDKDLEKIAIGFLDLDHFKKFNDECGHQAGDSALIIIADIMRNLTRDSDFIGRYGGEEFVFVLPEITLPEAKQFAERIRVDIEEKGKLLKHRFKNNMLTASIGIAMYHPQYENYQNLIDAADKAMYQAKHSGRNKVIALNEFDS